ncbi:MAG TPA: methyltransferase domain-containing protein [bacterium]|nr:methyltransferase domain-containing protein [bacterium]HPN45194.1 methyltransferase domain-containing protein [bacterium]
MTEYYHNTGSQNEIDLIGDVFSFIIPKYREAHDIMVSMLDFNNSAEIRVADLGCGFGDLSGRVFEVFPQAVIFGVDRHPEILTRVKTRFAGYANQFVPVDGDLNHLSWSTNLSALQAVISSFTLDYLPAKQQKDVIARAFEILESGGRWVSCEFFRAGDTRINRVFHDIEIMLVQNAIKNGQVTGEQIEQLSGSSLLRQEHHVCKIEEKIDWLKQAGFRNIEVPWRFLNIAIISAVR